MTSQYDDLKNRLAEIQDLNKIQWVLGWDQRTMMPAKGSPARAEQLATLSRVIYEKSTSAELGNLLDDLRAYEESQPYESDEASLIRVTRRDFEKLRRVPADLRVEMTRTGALASQTWIEARKQSNFSIFLPLLEKTLELKQRYIECFAPYDEAYDVLLDDFEPGMKTSQVKAIFDDLKRDLVPLISAVAARKDAVSDACVHGRFPIDKQNAFILTILDRFGFKSDSWRLDPTVHPFASNSSPSDIRITTRYYDNFLNPALFGSMHECGHGLYENGVSESLYRTPLARGASLGLHESQSRMWENLVGRSRSFWRFFYPQLQAAFPEAFSKVEMETFYRAINKIQPSFIRVEADEATYNLHIILRFEIEQEIISGKLNLRDLPEVWNAKMKELLGVDVADDAKGVLQDIHWSGGQLGYFPTYSLGNIISCQIWEKALEAMPDLYTQFEQGEFMALREWLRENLHRHGRKFSPQETIKMITGGPIQVGPYMRYLNGKAQDIYGF
ncbi:MAG: carboxypeptidase M32 [Anaerolineaceae bacterium]|nr:carboxypeptidase M32 [Anaerolineaceae bacterium]